MWPPPPTERGRHDRFSPPARRPAPPRLRPGSPSPHWPRHAGLRRRSPRTQSGHPGSPSGPLGTPATPAASWISRRLRQLVSTTLFRMWSNTKPIAGVATLILYERGLLTPDDPVAKFPTRVRQSAGSRALRCRWKRSQPSATSPSRDCLTNTTGLANPATMPHFYRQQYRDVLTTLGWIGQSQDAADAPAPNNRERVRAQAQLPLGRAARRAIRLPPRLPPALRPCSRRPAVSAWTPSSERTSSTP